jgi:hypothetical protein
MDVHVSVGAVTDLLPNVWLEALSINQKNLRQCIPCHGGDFRTLGADNYQALPTHTICSVQHETKIMTVIVIILVIIPIETSWIKAAWAGRDIGAQKRNMLYKNIITRDDVSCAPLLMVIVTEV